MKTPHLAIILVLLICGSNTIKAASPSDDSINELLTLSHAEKIIDAVMLQMDGYLKNTFKQMSAGREETPQMLEMQQKMQTKTVTLLKEELDWNRLKDLYIKIYRETFTQEEVDGIIAFYKTPTGQALISKMPAIMQKSMMNMQERMAPMMKKLQDSMQEIAKEYQSK